MTAQETGPHGARTCAGCDATTDLRAIHSETSGVVDTKVWCQTCCPELWCEACLSTTGGQCREHQTENE